MASFLESDYFLVAMLDKFGLVDWSRYSFTLIVHLSTHEYKSTAGTCSSMRKGVYSGRPRANFPRKILKENQNLQEKSKPWL